jgi:hypothetical protein
MKKLLVFIFNFFKNLFGFGTVDKTSGGSIDISTNVECEINEETNGSETISVIEPTPTVAETETETEIVIEKPAKSKKPRTRKPKKTAEVNASEENATVGETPVAEAPKKKRPSKRKKKSE